VRLFGVRWILLVPLCTHTEILTHIRSIDRFYSNIGVSAGLMAPSPGIVLAFSSTGKFIADEHRGAQSRHTALVIR